MEKSVECVGYVVTDGVSVEMPFLTYDEAMQYCRQIGIKPDDKNIICDFSRAKMLAKIMVPALMHVQSQIESERSKEEEYMDFAIASRNQISMMQVGAPPAPKNVESQMWAQHYQGEIFSRSGKTHGMSNAIAIIGRRIYELQTLAEMHD